MHSERVLQQQYRATPSGSLSSPLLLRGCFAPPGYIIKIIAKMKTLIMDRHSRFGLKTMCVWILFLTVLYGSYAVVTNSPLSGLLDKETGGFISLAFFVAWALVWFAIGRHFSRDYAMRKAVWKRDNPAIDDAEIDKAFRAEYFSHLAKMLSIVFFFAVLAYVAANVRGAVTLRNGIYIGTLMVLSIICGIYYKKHRRYCQSAAE